MSFSELGLRPELLRAIADSGYDTPTPVQTEAIPIVLAGRDLMAGAQTGTGKTAAFVLPILQRLHESPVELDRRAVRALILVPTRELAIQVEESVQTYGKHAPLRSVAVYGGASLPDQLRELDAGAEIVVATPGRLLDLVWRGSIDFGAVEFLVLDEADRMLDMGFIDDIRMIISLLPKERQSLLFSATFPEAIKRLTKTLLREPATVQVTPPNSTTALVDHVVLRVEDSHKKATLSHLISNGHVTSALVFVRTKHGADRLTNQLARDGIRVAAIHGDRAQSQRIAALEDFKDGRIHVLVATEVAARGIDIDALPYVVNYDLPRSAEDYVHRIGRTGRAGVDGVAISLVSESELPYLRDIEQLIGKPIPVEQVPGFVSAPRPRAEGRSPANGRGETAVGSRYASRQSTNRRTGPAHRSSGPRQTRSTGSGRGSWTALPGERTSGS
ncbi:MAG: DEAD/DEAH box helicase [Chloroflexi bacterium]|nr:DEAD/DEAH box helicase [Chloroflexota bacterium]